MLLSVWILSEVFCHLLNFNLLLIRKLGEPFSWHVVDIEIEFYEIIRVNSCDESF